MRCRFIFLIAIIVPFLLLSAELKAQSRVKAPVKLKIEDGDFTETTVTIRNTTSGESNSIPGTSKFDLELKGDCEYIISFQKPGYITKRIAFNTKAPGDRSSQGFYPFTFEVNLFKQYDGVNIVVFNQPVGKIEFNRMIDDFDYDTDYTKQIQSALKQAEEEIRKKQAEERAMAEQNKKEEAKRKAEEAAQAKADLKAKQEAEKKAAEEARLATAEAARQKKIEEEETRKRAKAEMDEEKRKQAVAKMEEEERARLKAMEDEEARKRAAAVSGDDPKAGSASAVAGESNRPKPSTGSGSESRGTSPMGNNESVSETGKANRGGGEDGSPIKPAEPEAGLDKGMSKAVGTAGSDTKSDPDQPDPTTSNATKSAVKTTTTNNASENQQKFEVMPEMTVEEISESNRRITRVTVRKGPKETVFSKVVYTWGGVYYFRAQMSISESLFFMNTGMR